MAKKITSKKIFTNLILSILTQIVSLAVTFILFMIVPKFVEQTQYAYWQTYILYSAQVTILHFGIIDGLVLRYSQYDYDEIDKERIRSQFKIILAVSCLFSLLTIIIASIFCSAVTKILVILVAVSMVTKNVILYTSYTFQITNRINKYAVFIILQKLSYGVLVIILLTLRVYDFYWYCIADLFGDFVAICISPIINKGMYFGRSIKGKSAFAELKENVRSGIVLMLANYSAMLLTSGAKMVVQWKWDEITFGTVSFAFSVTSLFLTFVAAISVVLFPSLKRMDESSLIPMYKTLRGSISIILFFLLLFYFPGCWILSHWLPKYNQSLVYLGLLLPIIVFSSKVSLLTNNYLKFYRKERTLFIINIISACIGILSFVLCAFVFNNLFALLICVVIVIMFNSICSEIFVSRIIHVNLLREFIIELLMTISFIVIVSKTKLLVGFLIYLGCLVVYLAINYKNVMGVCRKIFKKKKRCSVTKEETENIESGAEADDNTDSIN